MSEKFPSINSEIQQLQDVETTISEVFKHCDRMKSDILEYSQNSCNELVSLKESMQNLAELQRQIAALSSAALKIEDLVESDAEDENDVLKKFDNVLKSCQNEECIDDFAERAILAVEDFIATSQRTDEPMDDDLLVTETTESYKDPLTKLTMEDPVKSRICNHSYERNSILKYLERFSNCPYSGCRSALRRNDLVDDLQLKNKLLSIKREQID